MPNHLPIAAQTAEIRRAIFWMRNWVYFNLIGLITMIALLAFVARDVFTITAAAVPAFFFCWGLITCLATESHLRRGSFANIRFACFTCNLAVGLVAILAFPVSIGSAALAILGEWLGAGVAFAIFVVIFFFIRTAARTERILLRATMAVAGNGATFGFPVEFEPPAAK